MMLDTVAAKITLSDDEFGMEITKNNKSIADFMQDFSFRLGDVQIEMGDDMILDAKRINSDEVFGSVCITF